MRKKLFIDTSAWLALYIPTEKFHDRTARVVKDEITGGALIYTSNYVINETITRLLYDTGWPLTEKFLGYFKDSITTGSIQELWVDEQIEAEALRIFTKYREHKLSVTDATSVAIMKRYDIDAIITLDSDFAKIGLRVLP